MCSFTCALVVATNLSTQDIAGKKVLEVGSYDVNGSVRGLIQSYLPSEYVGVDIEKGPGVDIVCDAEKLLNVFPPESFDVVFSTELLEHVLNPKKVISNLKNICRRNGIMLFTTCSKGFVFHPSPYDFWRYEPSDMQKIFSDCEVINLRKSGYGVFIKVRKPENFVERDLSSLELYNIAMNQTMTEMAFSDMPMKLRLKLLFYNMVRSTFHKFDTTRDQLASVFFKLVWHK